MRISQLKSAFFVAAFLMVGAVLSFALVRDRPATAASSIPNSTQQRTVLFLLTGIVGIIAFGGSRHTPAAIPGLSNFMPKWN
jgi:hypothetical protein